MDAETESLLRSRLTNLQARQEEIRAGRAPLLEQRTALQEEHERLGHKINELTAQIRADDPELIKVKESISACATALGAQRLSGK